LNSCRHRGMKVCRADEGNTEAFTCSYHAWTYASDGRLIGVPHYKEAYFEELDRAQWGLVPVAQLDAYRGLIFATWDASAPALGGHHAGEPRWRARHGRAPPRSGRVQGRAAGDRRGLYPGDAARGGAAPQS